MVKIILTLYYFYAWKFTEIAGGGVEIADGWFIFNKEWSQKSSLFQKRSSAQITYFKNKEI